MINRYYIMQIYGLYNFIWLDLKYVNKTVSTDDYIHNYLKIY